MYLVFLPSFLGEGGGVRNVGMGVFRKLPALRLYLMRAQFAFDLVDVSLNLVCNLNRQGNEAATEAQHFLAIAEDATAVIPDFEVDANKATGQLQVATGDLVTHNWRGFAERDFYGQAASADIDHRNFGALFPVLLALFVTMFVFLRGQDAFQVMEKRYLQAESVTALQAQDFVGNGCGQGGMAFGRNLHKVGQPELDANLVELGDAEQPFCLQAAAVNGFV